jgi:hypothetical protein
MAPPRAVAAFIARRAAFVQIFHVGPCVSVGSGTAGRAQLLAGKMTRKEEFRFYLGADLCRFLANAGSVSEPSGVAPRLAPRNQGS